MGANREREVRRVGALGDVHTESRLLERALTHLRDQGVDALVCTGDIPDGPEGARGTERACELLQQAGVLTVSGNHERWMNEGEMRELPDAVMQDELGPAALEYLHALPPVLELSTPQGRLLLCHGVGYDDMAKVGRYDRGQALALNQPLQELLAEKRYRYVINGHSHQSMVRNLGPVSIINAGTLLRDHNPCCALVDFENQEVTFWEIDPQGELSESGRFELG